LDGIYPLTIEVHSNFSFFVNRIEYFHAKEISHLPPTFTGKIRERVMKLISKAYSLLNLTSMATLSGLSLDEARQAVIDMRWDIIDGTIVQPRKYIDEAQNNVNEFSMTEEKLHKFTEFVSFLEN